ncbi:quinon protein alcohol dehydrogenase-like superfamily [Aspergillus falconensis]
MAPVLAILSKLKPRRSKKRDDGTPPPPPQSQPASTSQGVTDLTEDDDTVTPDVNSNKLSMAEKLWSNAYDSLKAQDTELVTAYEKVLSRELCATTSDAQDNAIESTDAWKRQIQMEKLVQVGMQRTGEGNPKVEKTMQSVLGVGNVIGTALQPVPQAALAWVGVSLVLQMLVNPTTETRANREGVSYIAARMDWYGELSQLLLKENTVDGGMSANLCSKLEGRIVDLYTLLLSYLMKSVCSCYQNRVLKYFQNVIKHNDWEGSLKEIHHAEKLVAQDATQYNTQQIRSDLEELVSVARDRQTKLLSNIQEAVRNQAALQKTKDKLLKGSCDWIFDREDFSNWIYGDETTLYWIKGEPGKGKTMLLIGIIKQMLQSISDIGLVSFFFCQNTDPNLNNATAVLRGLIYQLAVKNRSLLSYIHDAYDSRGQSLFDDHNAFFALSKILSKMLDDPNIPDVYLIIDALDECQTDLEQLLELLMQHVSSSRLRCLVSSRPRSEIRNSLANSNNYTELDLGRNALQEVTEVVEEYIDREIEDLAKQKKYNNKLQREVKDYLQLHADGTFLWVSLTFPAGLHALYGRMMEEVCQGDKESPETTDYCRRILAAVTVAHRPLDLDDLGLVANLPTELTEDSAAVEEVVDLCGNFLVVREGTIYFVHHSAKEYLFAHIDKDFFQEGHIAIHSRIVLRALETGSGDGTIEIWNTKTRVVERVFSGDTDSVWSVAISPNGTKIASGSGRGTVRIWKVSTGSVIKTFEGHEDIVRSVTFSLDGKMVISGSYDRTIRIWDVQTGCLRHILRGHTDSIKSVAFLGNSQLVSCGWDKTIRFWDANTGDSHHVLEPDMGPIHAIIPLANGERLAIGAARGVQIWHSKHAELLATLVQCAEGIEVSSLATSSNGRHLVAGFRDGAVRIWNPETGIVQQILQTAAPVDCIAITDDGQKVALASTVTIYLWDTDIQTHQGPLTAHTSIIGPIEVSPCQKWIATGANDGTVGLWDRATGLMVRMLHGHSSGIWALSFSRDGRWIASASDDSTIRIWDLDTGGTVHVLVGHTDRLTSVMFSADGKKIVSGARDKTIRIWDTDTGNLISTIPTQCSFTAAYSPDGRLIASGSINGLLEMRDAKTGNLIRNFVDMERAVWSIQFTPDGNYLASTDQAIVRIYSVQAGILQQTIKAEEVRNLRFSIDSSTLITSRGQIALDWSLPQDSNTNASWLGYCLDSSEAWVTWNGKRLLRLPLECGSLGHIVTEQMIVLGYSAGRIVIFEFDNDISPFGQ